MLNTPFAPWPSFTPEEADAVSRVLLSNRVNYWTGEETRKFETEFAAWAGANYAIAVANGTVAIDLAWPALGIGEGDEVIVTPRTFLASASSPLLAGARPVFADVDRDSQNITPETIEPLINERTKAIFCVHLAGWPCEMDGLVELAKAHDLALVEDCAQAHGAQYRGRSVGTFGDIGAWSFCQDKIITTGGEGGMVTTQSEELWSRMWAYKDHGKSYDAVYRRQHPPGFRWIHEGFGTNGRMTEMQAVIGRIQLGRMPDWHAERQRNAKRLMAGMRNLPGVRIPDVPEHIEHAWYKLYIFAEPAALASGWSRDRIIAEIVAEGVPCYAGSCSEVYLEKAFDDTGLRPEKRLPVARELGETSMMFLVHPGLRDEELQKTVDVTRAVLLRAAR